MKWASASSAHPDDHQALAEAADALRAQLGDAEPDLVLAFASPHHTGLFQDLPGLVAQRFPRALLLGCTAGGVIGGGHELEQKPGLALMAAALPGVQVQPFHLEAEDLPPVDAGRRAWSERIGLRQPAGELPADTHFVLMPEPFSVDAEELIRGLDAAFPATCKIGGQASGGQKPGSHALWLGGATFRSGVVGVALHGAVQIDTVVAQGCRPIGQPMLITRCERNLILELDSQPPLAVLASIAGGLDERDKELFRENLLVGIEMNADQEEYRQGDFLIRQIVGIDTERAAVAIASVPQQWQVLQFHLRDASAAAEDLGRRLERYHRDHAVQPPAGALLFSCVGRGSQMFGRADHDTGLFRQYLGAVPLGGFFCNGEIGPVCSTAFLHGFTSVFALFRTP